MQCNLKTNTMKNALLVLGFSLFVLQAKAQTSIASDIAKESKTTIEKIEITLNNLNEMEEIDWDEVFTVFEDNAPKDSIEVALVLKDYRIKDEKKLKISIPHLRLKVEGQTRDAEKLKVQMKKNIRDTRKALLEMKKKTR